MKDDYLFYKEKKICVQCRQYDAAPGRVRCEVCLAKNAESSSKKIRHETRRREEIRKEKNKLYLKELRRSRKEQGMCIMCGKLKCTQSTVFCYDCYIKNQKNNNKRKKGIARHERIDYGLCYICGKKVSYGKHLCEKCCGTAIGNLPNNNANNPNYNKWKEENNLLFI